MATYDINTDTIPSDLAIGDIVNAPSNTANTYKTLTLKPGVYRLQAWGAGNNGDYGYGAYAKGDIRLMKETTLYLYTGRTRQVNGSRTPGTSSSSGKLVDNGGFGFPWGGDGYNSYYGSKGSWAGAGGGCSAICINNNSLNARVLVAGGSGGRTYDYMDSSNLSESGCGIQQAYVYQYNGSSYSNIIWKQTMNARTQSTSKQNATTWNYKYSPGAGGGGWTTGIGNTSDSANSATVGPGGTSFYFDATTRKYLPYGWLLSNDYMLSNCSAVSGRNTYTTPQGSTGRVSGDGYIRITVLGKDLNKFQDNICQLYVKKDGSWVKFDSLIPIS